MSSTVEKYYENNPEAENINPNTIRKNNDFETLYPELAEEFKKIQKEQYDLFASKMMDYGLGNISLGSDLNTREDRDLSLTGIWLRCTPEAALAHHRTGVCLLLWLKGRQVNYLFLVWRRWR